MKETSGEGESGKDGEHDDKEGDDNLSEQEEENDEGEANSKMEASGPESEEEPRKKDQEAADKAWAQRKGEAVIRDLLSTTSEDKGGGKRTREGGRE
jgi:hypothetical protein